jgi:hypothetical protein
VNIAKCSSCGRAIVWATSPLGARIPLDARPAVMYYIDEQAPPRAFAVKAEIIKRPDLFSEPTTETPKTYVSHFLTCPNAADHSKGGRS